MLNLVCFACEILCGLWKQVKLFNYFATYKVNKLNVEPVFPNNPVC